MNWASGSMTISDDSVVSSNASYTSGTSTYGGGINNYGDLVISDTFVGNNQGVNGGGLHNDGGTVSVHSSSFVSNHASNKGGAWANVDSSSGTVAFHTFAFAATSNAADVDCDRTWDNVSSSCVN